MISVNCGAIPEKLLESELFGYEKGAFTGADRKGKKGLVEQAKRQLKASEGSRIQWYFAEKDTLNAVKALFMDNNIKGIELIYEPYK